MQHTILILSNMFSLLNYANYLLIVVLIDIIRLCEFVYVLILATKVMGYCMKGLYLLRERVREIGSCHSLSIFQLEIVSERWW
ncbi:hypothetical protein QVD17_17922 [Tagetes erecta]|uniref:Uncharacterized protein n=1 Tax=Tagetes erecta TaxID=13708 RepID=A0AAD8KK73_TARER|nr:hypothetical protein QVD17_17922 [Tagetes erecta]